MFLWGWTQQQLTLNCSCLLHSQCQPLFCRCWKELIQESPPLNQQAIRPLDEPNLTSKYHYPPMTKYPGCPWMDKTPWTIPITCPLGVHPRYCRLGYSLNPTWLPSHQAAPSDTANQGFCNRCRFDGPQLPLMDSTCLDMVIGKICRAFSLPHPQFLNCNSTQH